MVTSNMFGSSNNCVLKYFAAKSFRLPQKGANIKSIKECNSSRTVNNEIKRTSRALQLEQIFRFFFKKNQTNKQRQI